jgi:hypothetical protein
LTAFFTWPLLISLLSGAGNVTPGIIIEDRDQNLWNLWWVREAVLSWHNPFVTDYIYHPEGVSLYFHTLNVFNGLLAVPLLSLFSLTTTYNIIVFFSFAMTGWGAFLLVHYLCGNRWAALVGSVAFAYSAYHIATMRGLLQLISLEWVPFFVLALLLATYAPDWTRTRDAWGWLLRRGLPAAVALLLISLVDWYYTMFALMIAGLLALYQVARFVFEVLREKNPHVWRDLGQPLARIAACLAVWVVLVSPILIPTLAELRSQRYMVPSHEETVANSADLLAFFQPGRDNRLWGHYFDRSDWPYGGNLYEVYLTYTTLFLAAVGLFSTRSTRPDVAEEGVRLDQEARARLPGKWYWAASALLFFLLALGPVLQVGGRQVTLQLPMPYSVVERLPVLSISRSPDRFVMPLTLCLSVLAGYGTNQAALWVAQRAQRRTDLVAVPPEQAKVGPPAERLSGAGSIVSLAAVGLIALELAPIPYPQLSAAVPRWYEEVGGESGDFTIFELPPQDDYWHGAFRMYFATAHGRPIYGGYISREFPHPFVESTPGYMDLAATTPEGDMISTGRDEWLSALNLYGTRYVVLQKDRLPDVVEEPPDVSLWRASISRVLASEEPVYEDEQLAAYVVPTLEEHVPFLSIGDGWEPKEVGPNGPFRWMRDEATLRIDSPSRTDATLRFNATTIGEPRRMVVRHGDVVVFDEEVGPLLEYAVRLGLPEGKSELTIMNPEGTVTPSELGLGDDPRELGFAWLKARLEK